MASKTYQPMVFRVQALTNLHPGSGDSFYGAVDKLVQRDPATRIPTIHSHSLKGALREYFEEVLNYLTDPDPAKKQFITDVFGSPITGKADQAAQGKFRFFSADLLAIPVPDEDPNASTTFHLESPSSVWEAFSHKIQLLGDTTWQANNLKAAFQTGAPAFSDKNQFKIACDELPVIARNQLENGESQNLWYEELVPHQSIFGFIVQADKADMLLAAEFSNALHNQVVQIGANATVGYGYCLITQIKV